MVKRIEKTPPIKIDPTQGKPDYQGALAFLRGEDPEKIIRTGYLSELEPHPFALEFPPYAEAELAELAGDIREHGLIEPLTVDLQKRILDGVNRADACKRAGLEEVPILFFDGGDNAKRNFVFAKNMLRRHLTDDQRAGIAARFATMGHGGDRKSGPGIKPPNGGLKVADAAAQAKVSKRTVERAKAVDKQDPALLDDVIAGKTKLADAAKTVATSPPPPSAAFKRAEKMRKEKLKKDKAEAGGHDYDILQDTGDAPHPSSDASPLSHDDEGDLVEAVTGLIDKYGRDNVVWATVGSDLALVVKVLLNMHGFDAVSDEVLGQRK